ncbi:UNVERIFIED_CONTAM: hypothetical protein Scaly_0448000 [Sesamum calycinum]|uniref:Uncharacterized protein n=1 Tax=Sesamum calycinum TaxID=2727403 RepID=A0AAW2SER1_9LAMI
MRCKKAQDQILAGPRSNFRRRSPVPEIKFQPVYSDDSVDSVSENKLDDTRKGFIEPEADDLHELKIESNAEPLLSERNAFDEMSEDETSEIYASEHGDEEDEHNLLEASDLSGMKLTELRSLAKSRA